MFHSYGETYKNTLGIILAPTVCTYDLITTCGESDVRLLIKVDIADILKMNRFFQIFSCVCRENEYRLIRRRQNIEPGSYPQQIQPARREMGIMPQNNSLNNMFTGRLGHYIIRMIYFVIKVTE